MAFTHLHVHSNYSLLQAVPKLPDLINKAKGYGMKALALTDNGNMYGTIEFYQECLKKEIKPIIGVDFYVASRTRHDREGRLDAKTTRLLLLAKNYDGYMNLIKLVTDSNLEGFYYRPRIDNELIQKYNKDLICIIPFDNSEISNNLKINDFDVADKIYENLKTAYGAENIYYELLKQEDIIGSQELEEKIITFSQRHGIEMVATNNVLYIEPEDKKARLTMLSIQSNNPDRNITDDGDFSFISPERASELFSDSENSARDEIYKKALANTEVIADQCNFEIELGKWVFPKMELPEGKDANQCLREVVYEGFAKRNVEQDEVTIKRVEYELEVIKNKGYSPYFLIVADLLKYAKEHEILSNIRGSVCGSMVTYLSGITHINPIEYQIPFERFLNPERPSAPDIDMDYADDRRAEMVDYARAKYGKDKVAQIGTFGTMAARGSVKDVARALGYPYELGDRISKLIPMGSQGFPMTIKHALEITEELRELYEKNGDVKTIIDMAQKIEGCARHISVHAAGVVISPTELTDFTPLQYDTKGENKIISQYDMYSVEEAGLLKFDFLGLKNLKIIAECKKLIRRIHGKEIDIDNMAVDDEKTFQMLARGETVDLFQLNGEGMTKYLVDLKPTSIHDINAMVALYRPGPIQFIPLYIERKHNPSLITYMDPMLEDILEKTYGVLVYQDDLLMMAHKIAGYSWGEVDKFRKAVGKKIPEEMAKQKEKFIDGCVSHGGWSKQKATDVWKWIEPFAAYGFNKSHSVSYGRVAYITAYLKANYPAEYMASVLTSESGDVDSVAVSVKECLRMNIEVLAPNVNSSFGTFTVLKNHKDERDAISFGLYSIKNFGEGIADSIFKERNENGIFTSIENLLERITDKNLNKKSLEALIKSGAMDDFGDRIDLLENLDRYLDYNKTTTRQDKAQGNMMDMLFGATETETLKEKVEQRKESLPQRLRWEKELLGIYLSGHPLDKYKEAWEKKKINIDWLIKNGEEGEIDKNGKRKVKNYDEILGLVEGVKEIATKKDPTKKMVFFKLKDMSGEIECVVFPKQYEDLKHRIKDDTVIEIKYQISLREEKKSLIIDNVTKVFK
jgi:DNA polymerase-3 subunit alpha